MEFGLDKCTKATFRRGRLADSSNIELNFNPIIQDLDLDQEGTGRQSPALSDEREDPQRVLLQDPDGTQVWAELCKQTGSHQHLGSTSGNLQF